VTSGTAVDAATFVVLPGVDEPLRLESRPVPRPAPGQALVRVEACGVCGSDLFLQEGGFGAGKLPVVPGHEAAGRVVAVGDAADEALVGRQVALYYIDAPPTSRWAVAGHGNVGPDVQRMGVDVDGALADFVVRPVSTLVVVDPAMDPASVAVATDAWRPPGTPS
jgi:D-arabinose 1-dehydrogenase-like Zn-dependent alcohol dehydrogenase